MTTLPQIATEEFERAEIQFSLCDDKEYERHAEAIARRYGLQWQWTELGRIEFEEVE